MIAARTAQAGLVARIWNSLLKNVDPESATKILTAAIQSDAMAAGQTFASQAPHGPTLEHFATILERWQENDALTIRDVRLAGSTLTFTVTDCAYAGAYAGMGLSPELGAILSCARDEPFANGYSPCLSMRRSQTIMLGHPCCHFTFAWRE